MFLFEHILVIASRSSREKKLKKKLQQKKLGWWRNNYNFKSFLINIIRLRFREQPVQGASNWKCNKYLQDLGVSCYRFYGNIDNELWSNLETLYNFPIFRFDLQFDINGLRSSYLKCQHGYREEGLSSCVIVHELLLLLLLLLRDTPAWIWI